MIKLIIIELTKIFHKKFIYVVLSLMLIFCLLNNTLYYLDYDEEGFYKKEEKNNTAEIKKLEDKITKYDKNNENDKTMYTSLKTKIDILNLKNNFPKNTWQYNKTNDYFYDIIYQRNTYTYLIEDEIKKKEIENTYQEKLTKLTKGDWKYFLNQEKEELEKKKRELASNLKNTNDTLEKENINIELEYLSIKLKTINYRLENQVLEEKTYLNESLKNWEESTTLVSNLTRKTNLTKEEQITLNNALAKVKVNEYILKNKQNINKENSLNYELRTIIEDYEFFIVILILMVASTIICEEFNKGTIKLLLIKPYSRGKILISKYCTCLFILLLTICFLILIQLGIGTYLFKTESLKLPVIVYHFSKKELIEYTIWQYMLIRILSRLPFYILLLTISFTLSTFFTSTVVSIMIPMIIYLFDSIIINIGIKYKITIIKYLLNPNWHFEKYLFGNTNEIASITIKESIIICIVYFVVLSICTILYFQKKNIKNI